jgi:hypothetical protein
MRAGRGRARRSRGSDIRMTVLFWVFVATYISTVAVTVFGMYQQVLDRSKDVPFLGWLIGAVLVETALVIFAFWKDGSKREEEYLEQEDTALLQLMDRVIVLYTLREIESRNLEGAISLFHLLRDTNLLDRKQDLLVAELGVRRLLGHGQMLSSKLDRLISTDMRARFHYEIGLLSYANKEDRIKAAPNFKDLSSLSRHMWNSLLALDASAHGEEKVARRFFNQIDHNAYDYRTDISTESRVLTSYTAMTLVVPSACLGDTVRLEMYLDIVRKMNSLVVSATQVQRLNPLYINYPNLLLISGLYHAFVMNILDVGGKSRLSPDQIRLAPGMSKIVARHCRVLADNARALDTFERMSTSYARPIKASPLRVRLRRFERHLIAHSVNVVSGSSILPGAA